MSISKPKNKYAQNRDLTAEKQASNKNNIGGTPNTSIGTNTPRPLPSGTYYDGFTGKKISNPNTYTGTVFSADGSTRYNVVNGQIRSVEQPIKTTINVDNKSRSIYKLDTGYYYFDGKKIRKLTDERQIEYAKNNEDINLIYRGDDEADLSQKTETAKKEEPKKQTSSGGTPGYDAAYNKLATQNKELMEYIYELEHPKVLSAEEAAKLYGIDYNLQNILDAYNEKTNTYYDTAIGEQQDLRTNYAKNNSNYYDQVTDSYIDSYKNAAPTATGKGALAANALSTMLSAGQTNSENDYGMLQNINSYEQSRAAELVNNKQLAEDYYNSLGLYLSQLSAQENASAVKQYVAKLDSYSDMYAADRALQAYQAEANAAKYSGLVGSKIAKAGSTASGTTAWDQMYNYYYNASGGDSKYASQKVHSYVRDYQNSGSY